MVRKRSRVQASSTAPVFSARGRSIGRDAGVVDRAALEMRCTGNCTGGSNPSLSARAGKAAMKSQLFYFGEQPGLPEAARQNKKVAFRHFPALAGTPPAGKGTASCASQSRPDRRCRAVRIKCRPPLRQIAAGRQGNGEQSKTILPRPTMPRSSNKIPPAAPPDRRRQARERRATRANPAHG